jgi:hypothetical protein
MANGYRMVVSSKPLSKTGMGNRCRFRSSGNGSFFRLPKVKKPLPIEKATAVYPTPEKALHKRLGNGFYAFSHAFVALLKVKNVVVIQLPVHFFWSSPCN